MRRRRPLDTRILFPWEGRSGLWRWVGLRRFRVVLAALGVVAFVGVIGARERRDAGTRQSRAALLGARRAVDAYLSDHDGGCPPSLAAVIEYRHLKELPRDAWGRPLRLICPGRHDDAVYELMSDGPDGEPGGLDRIE